MRKAAKWIRHSHFLDDDEYECPICGYTTDEPYNECPNCGNRMSGSMDDHNWIDEIEKLNMMLDD